MEENIATIVEDAVIVEDAATPVGNRFVNYNLFASLRILPAFSAADDLDIFIQG